MLHYCQGYIVRNGQLFWGSPHAGGPISEPIPDWVLEKHPDVITDWVNCDNCGTPMCGKPARHKLSYEDESEVWLCADHYDEYITTTTADGYHFPNWHEPHDWFCKERGAHYED